jgi:hypothetical protein
LTIHNLFVGLRPEAPKYVEPGLEALGFSEPRWHAEFVDLGVADPADPALPSRRGHVALTKSGILGRTCGRKIDLSVNQVTFGSGDMVNYWRHSLQERL